MAASTHLSFSFMKKPHQPFSSFPCPKTPSLSPTTFLKIPQKPQSYRNNSLSHTHRSSSFKIPSSKISISRGFFFPSDSDVTDQSYETLLRSDKFIEECANAGIYDLEDRLFYFFGQILATESPADCDMVIASPYYGPEATIGFANKADVPYEPGLLQRTSIEPLQKENRDFEPNELKLAPAAVLEGKRVILVGDFFKRWRTPLIVRLLKDAGAKEVHVRIASPPIMSVSFTDDYQFLYVCNGNSMDDPDFIGCESLAFLSPDTLE